MRPGNTGKNLCFISMPELLKPLFIVGLSSSRHQEHDRFCFVCDSANRNTAMQELICPASGPQRTQVNNVYFFYMGKSETRTRKGLSSSRHQEHDRFCFFATVLIATQLCRN